jgi:hypothetical protein
MICIWHFLSARKALCFLIVCFLKTIPKPSHEFILLLGNKVRTIGNMHRPAIIPDTNMCYILFRNHHHLIRKVQFLPYYTMEKKHMKMSYKLAKFSRIRRTRGGGSMMVTGAQKQPAWAPWIKNLAEMLEPYLAQIKHKGESKVLHPEPLACRKLLHAMLHCENRWVVITPSHWFQTCLGDIQQTKQESTKGHAVFPQPLLQ